MNLTKKICAELRLLKQRYTANVHAKIQNLFNGGYNIAGKNQRVSFVKTLSWTGAVKRATSWTCHSCKNKHPVLCFQITAHRPSSQLSLSPVTTALHWPLTIFPAGSSLYKQTRNHPPLKSLSDHSPRNNLIMKTAVSLIIYLPSFYESHDCLDAGVPGRVPGPAAHCRPRRVRPGPGPRPLHCGGAPGGQPPWTRWTQG